MDSHVTEDATSAFAAILADICNQTKTQGKVEDEYDAFHHGASPPCPQLSSQLQDDIYRYEPLLDPALSYIHDILEEDNVLGDIDSSFSYGELVAYQAKASELAAILKEDSPTLGLDVKETSAEPHNPSLCNSGTSFANDQAHATQDLSNVDIEAFLSDILVSEPYRNTLLLNSLRGPQAGERAPPHGMPMPSLDVGLQDACANQQPSVEQGMQKTGAHVGTGTSTRLHRLHKVPKRGSALKPRTQSTAFRKKKKASSRESIHEYIDMNDLLLQCAQAIGTNNTKSAMEILSKVRQHASPFGNGAQRLAYYFSEALDARFSGMGWPLYMGHLRQRPSSAEILKATGKYMSSCPFAKAAHYFINHTILNVAKNASILHILELQSTGFQYPSLFKALATRPGGPPQVRLIGVGFPHYSMIPAQTSVILERLQKSGRQLAEYAASVGVPFHYTAWVGPRETLRMQDFVSPERRPEEVFVVISAHLLRYIMDDTLDPPPVRLKLLKMGRDINPDVYIQGIVTGSYSTPFFTRRFREALFHFESVYDMLDTFIEREDSDRVVFESEILGKAILNIVACEGTDVVERIDKYKNWQALTEEVGFQQLPLDEEIKGNIQTMLKSWHKEYMVAEDSQYLLMGWKGRMLHAMSTWKASPPH